VSFRARLALLCAGALAIALSMAVVVAYASERSSLGQELDALLRARAAQVTPDVVQEVLGANDLLPKQRKLAATGSHSPGKPPAISTQAHSRRAVAAGVGLADLVLVTSRGELAPASTSATGSVAPVGATARVVAADGSAPRFRTFSLPGAHVRAYIFHAAPGVAGVVAAPLRQVDASLGDLRLRFGVIAIATLLLVGLLAWLVARQAMRPVVALTLAAESVVQTSDLRARVRVAGSGRDELGRLANTMNAMLTALERSVGSQRQLVADASHELRTPLTTLITNLQLLDEPGGPQARDASELIAHARREADGLAALVSDLVELARSSEIELHLDYVRLDLIAAAAVHRVSRHTSGVSFREHLSPCTVRGDADLLERAIGNLLDNAAKWSPPGGTIELTVRDGEVSVTDEGPGIADADLPFVFDRFYRSPAARGQPGSGLGLAIVRQIAELHGSVTSAKTTDQGALLQLKLPVVDSTRLAMSSGDVTRDQDDGT
jgi:two-component system, OmpR family, sensor histidine kinase MprB